MGATAVMGWFGAVGRARGRVSPPIYRHVWLAATPVRIGIKCVGEGRGVCAAVLLTSSLFPTYLQQWLWLQCGTLPSALGCLTTAERGFHCR